MKKDILVFNGVDTTTIHESTSTFSEYNTLDELVIPNEF